MTLKKRKIRCLFDNGFSWSGYQDSNLGPSAPKADALTGLRYTPNRFATAKVDKKSIIPNFLMFFIGNISPCSCRNFAAEDVKKSSFYLVIKNFLHIFVEHNLLNHTFMNGKVKWFDSKKGYGFIIGEDGKEIFVHFTGIAKDGFKSLDEGQAVEFEIGNGAKGEQAIDVKVVVRK